MVVDDYGHHPTEIKATLSAAKRGWDRRTVVIFQPHRYTRTRDLFKDFLTAFNQADVLFLTGIYPAGEDPIPGVKVQDLYEGIKGHGHKDVTLVSDKGSRSWKECSPGCGRGTWSLPWERGMFGRWEKG